MKVLIVNTSASGGGAAIAALRLMDALRANGADARMLVRDCAVPHEGVTALPQSPVLRLKFVWERLVIWLHNRLSRRMLWYVDIANAGTDITRHPAFLEADVIHLHWVNQGFLSLDQLDRIFQSGKRIVWTLHDQWPYTGICHHSVDCTRYQHHCHHCPQLCHPSAKDLSYKVFARKLSIMRQARITFVGCSRWIAGLAEKSALTQGHRVVSVPNAVPSVFSPMDKAEARRLHGLPEEGKYILFGSCKVADRRKGADYLIEACRRAELQHVNVIIVGGHAEWMRDSFSQPVYIINYVHSPERMAALYAAADVYVTPSLQENLPNTIAEAMSVGTPCVGFEVGGIPEMIDHRQNGYVARYKDVADLAQGVAWVLDNDLRRAARQKASASYNPDTVAQQYISLYEE